MYILIFSEKMIQIKDNKNVWWDHRKNDFIIKDRIIDFFKIP